MRRAAALDPVSGFEDTHDAVNVATLDVLPSSGQRCRYLYGR